MSSPPPRRAVARGRHALVELPPDPGPPTDPIGHVRIGVDPGSPPARPAARRRGRGRGAEQPPVGSVLDGPDPAHDEPIDPPRPPVERKVTAATAAATAGTVITTVFALLASVVVAGSAQPAALQAVLAAFSVPAAAVPAVIAVFALLAQPAGVFWLSYRARHTHRPDLAPSHVSGGAATPRGPGGPTGSGDTPPRV